MFGGKYKIKVQDMKIPLTKTYVLLTKFDVPLIFTTTNSTGQHIISCDDPRFITGSPTKRQDHSKDSIYHMLRKLMKCCSSPIKNISFKRTWQPVSGRQYLVLVNHIWYLLKVFCTWSRWALSTTDTITDPFNDICDTCSTSPTWLYHCMSEEGLWLQGE